jgi:hypothetical protein
MSAVATRGHDLLTCACPRCGAALSVTLASLGGVRCPRCGHYGPPPAQVASRLSEAQRSLFASDAQARQFGHATRSAVARALRLRTYAVFGYGVGAFPSALAALLGVATAVGSRTPLSERATTVAFFSAPLVLYAVVAAITWRMLSSARAALLAAAAAIPPERPGDAATCNVCGAPVSGRAQEPIVRCAYCATDNVVHPAALGRAVGRKAIDLAFLGAAIRRRAAQIEAGGRRVATGLLVGIFGTPVVGWAGAFVLLVMGLLVEGCTEPPPSVVARYAFVETPSGTCVAKVVARGARSVADFGTNHALPVDLVVSPTATRFRADALKGRTLRIDDGSQGTVRTVYGSRLTDQDTVTLDPSGTGMVNGSCLTEAASPGVSAPASGAEPGGPSKRAQRTKELVDGSPSEEAFGRVLALFQPVRSGGLDEHLLPPWTSDKERLQSMEYASEKLAAWDDMLRVLAATGRADEVPDWGRLVRRFKFYRLDTNAPAAVTQAVRSRSLADVTIIEAVRCEGLPWKQLAAAPHLRPKRLIVSNTVVSNEDWPPLVKGTFSDLEVLELSEASNEIYGSILDGLPQLSRIVCRHCFGSSLAVVLARQPLLRRLEHLDFAGSVVIRNGLPSPLGDKDIDALAAASALSKLRVLDLHNNRFSPEARKRLRAAPQFAKTKTILD